MFCKHIKTMTNTQRRTSLNYCLKEITKISTLCVYYLYIHNRTSSVFGTYSLVEQGCPFPFRCCVMLEHRFQFQLFAYRERVAPETHLRVT